MFAPHPAKETSHLEAAVVDNQGIMHRYAFPTMDDRSPWEAIWGYRQSKFAANLGGEEFRILREMAARHVVRKMGLPGGRLPGRRAALLPGPRDAPAGRPAADASEAPEDRGDRHLSLPRPLGGPAMNPLRRWDAFWFRPTSARPLGAFRVLFGLVVLWHLATCCIEIDLWLTDRGLLQGAEASEVAGALRLSLLNHWQSPTAARLVLGFTAMAALGLTLGWRTRVMAVATYLGLLTIHHRNLATASGADVLVVLVAFSLMLSGCGDAYSLDARRRARRRGTEAEPLIAPWPQRLIQLQVSTVYFVTACLKASGPTWQDGTALHYVLGNDEVRRFTFGLTNYPLATNAMTYGALLLEFALAFLLWVRAARPWIMPLGIALHVAIGLTINIPVFGEVITACYLTFLTPEEFFALAHRLDPRSWFPSRDDRGRGDRSCRPRRRCPGIERTAPGEGRRTSGLMRLAHRQTLAGSTTTMPGPNPAIRVKCETLNVRMWVNP